MTSARIQQIYRKYNINIGCFDGFRVCPRTITEKYIALYVYKNHFCLVWKSQRKAFNKAIDGLKNNFQIVDNVISDKHVKSFHKYE